MDGIFTYIRRARWLHLVTLLSILSIMIGCAGAAAPSGGTATLVPLEIPMNDLPLAGSPVIGGVGSSLADDESDDEDDVYKMLGKAASTSDTFTLGDLANCTGSNTSECLFDQDSSYGYCLMASQFGSLAQATGSSDVNLCMMRKALTDANLFSEWGDGVSRHIKLSIDDLGSSGNAQAASFFDEWIDSAWLQMTVEDDVVTLADIRACTGNTQTDFYKHTLSSDGAYTLEMKYITDSEASHVSVTGTLDDDGAYTGTKTIDLEHTNETSGNKSRSEFTETASALTYDGFIYAPDDTQGEDYNYTRQYAIAALTDSNTAPESVDDYDKSLQGIATGSDNFILEHYADGEYAGQVTDRDVWDGTTKQETSSTNTLPTPATASSNISISFEDDETASCTAGYDVTLTIAAEDILEYYNSCQGYMVESANIACSTLTPDDNRIFTQEDAEDDAPTYTELEITSVTASESGNSSNSATLGQSSSSPENLDANLVSIEIAFDQAYDQANVNVNSNVVLETFPGGTEIPMGSQQVNSTTLRMMTTSQQLQSGQNYRLRLYGHDDLGEGMAPISADGDDMTRVMTTQNYYLSID